MNLDTILLNDGFFVLPKEIKAENQKVNEVEIKEVESVATILSNMAYYGYAPSKSLFLTISSTSHEKLVVFWSKLEPLLQELTGADKNIGEHILYQNFPKEVLDMSHSEYWLRQIFVYFGLPYSFVAEEKEYRPSIINEKSLKIIDVINFDKKEEVTKEVLQSLINCGKRWTDFQKKSALFLSENSDFESLIFNLENYDFKENGLELMVDKFKSSEEKIERASDDDFSSLSNRIAPKQFKILMGSVKKEEKPVRVSALSKFTIKDATDVLRLASGISGSGVRVNKSTGFSNFGRPERKALLEMLEKSNNLEKDMASRKEVFKRLLSRLRPGDYKNSFPRCVTAYDKLYNNKLQSDNSIVEEKIENKDVSVFEMLSSRPALLVRRFHELYNVFGKIVEKEVVSKLECLSTAQIISFKKYIETVNEREHLLFPPNGSWNKVHQVENKKSKLNELDALLNHLEAEIRQRLEIFYPEGFSLCSKMSNLKLQTNDQKLASYGRGTTFPIPENIQFIRTSSYWNIEHGTFLDNTWNFFDENWKEMGVCCWDNESFPKEEFGLKKEKGSVFSGDAVNSKDGKAAQLIDLYLDKLEEAGVRYAVWSILSFDNIAFSDFEECHAGLQMGENAQSGEVFEPSRVDFSFPLIEDSKVKIVAYIDIKSREIIYCDVNKGLSVRSGDKNKETLESFMPAYVEYLKSVPSYEDVFGLHIEEKGIPMLFSDKDVHFDKQVEKAFIFKRENTENGYKELLSEFNELMNFKRVG